jgi:hypothetical protein
LHLPAHVSDEFVIMRPNDDSMSKECRNDKMCPVTVDMRSGMNDNITNMDTSENAAVSTSIIPYTVRTVSVLTFASITFLIVATLQLSVSFKSRFILNMDISQAPSPTINPTMTTWSINMILQMSKIQ